MVQILLAKGYEEIEAIAVIDILRRAEVEVSIVSADGTECVTGGHGIEVKADIALNEAMADEMIILPGGLEGVENLMKNDGVISLIKKYAEGGKLIAAICAAPMCIGSMGLLKGHKATCYPGFEKHLEGAEISSESTVVSGNFITSKGPGTAYDFAYTLVEILKGEKVAENLKAGMQYGR